MKSRVAETDPPANPAEAVVNTFAGGQLEIVQFASGGHRAGLEALLLAAAVDRHWSGTVVDLGAGVGAVGLTVAARCPGARIVLVDCDARSLECASAALRRPANRAFAGRVSIVKADVGWTEPQRRSVGLSPAMADLVVTNPPFQRADAGADSPDPERRAAHVLEGAGLSPWIGMMETLLRPAGVALIIIACGRLKEVMQLLSPGFGGPDILPVQVRPQLPARRVLLRAVKGGRGPVRLFPPLVLHGNRGPAYLSTVEPVLRGRASLADVHPTWH